MNKMVIFLKSIRFYVLLFVMVLAAATSANGLEIQNIKSPKAINAWLVEDHTVPIISIQFSIGGGTTQDPQDKEGLAKLMTGLFDEGAGDIRSKEFQSKLDDLGAEMSFAVDRDTMRGSMRVLAENQEAAFHLLALAVQKPRFDQDAIDRIREQIIASLRAEEKNPATIAKNRLSNLIFGKHPYARRADGTPESLSKISREDLIKQHLNMFAQNNIHIGIVGPISAKQAEHLVDEIFGALPQKPNLKKIPNIKLNLGGMANVNYDLPQTSLTLVYPGVYRDDEAFFAAYLMNYILGGPGLTSRLFLEVREKRGLAYSVGSNMMLYDHAAGLMISTGTKASEAQKTLATIRDEVKKLANDGISQQELDDAKSYVIGSYAVKTMGSSTEIAATLVGLQDQNLPIDYIQKRADLINAVTIEQVNKIAKKLLSVEPALLIVGPSKD